MEFHYMVVYNTDTKSWDLIDETPYLPDGNVYDSEADTWYGWFQPDEQGSPTAYLIDERCRTMLTTLASIWPEVDHGDY
jgi:starvation-inducible outer membrane lipoprotein